VKKAVLISVLALSAVACSSQGGSIQDETSDLARQAASNVMCAIENQARCGHVIENRTLMSRFFQPLSFGGMNESEKLRGKRVTTNFVIEAAANIKQCRRISKPGIPILKNMEIAGGYYQLHGTSPLDPVSSTCFLTPQAEDPL